MDPNQTDADKAAEADRKAAEKAQKAADAARVKAEKAAQKEADKLAREQKRLQDKADKDAKKLADKKAREDKIAADKQAKLDAEKAKLEAKAALKMPSKNGITQPKAGTVTGRCWEVYNSMSAERGGRPVAIADAKKVLDAEGVNEATIRTQYAQWRKFHGVTGRIASDAELAAAEAAKVSG